MFIFIIVAAVSIVVLALVILFIGFLPVVKREIRYAEAVLKFAKLNTAAQQREAVVQGRSLLPYRLRYTNQMLDVLRLLVFFVFSVIFLF
ncbi:MAG: hypothetical protein LBK06_05395 [Planctomycetaceae bacterium]|nr:hypothetical protein [Planctomycetaceae bacterium]